MGASPWQNLDRLLDDAGHELVYATDDGLFFLQGALQFDNWVYLADNHGGPPGFFFAKPGRRWEIATRLTARIDAFFGDDWFGHLKVRWDDGVHPGVARFYGRSTEVRIDEAFLDFAPQPAFQLRIGQFTPILGNFMPRQNSWDMALINYPLIYENVTSVADSVVPANEQNFANRRNHPDPKTLWNSLVWAPLYTRGATVSGQLESWSYAVNFTATSPSSRGIVWNDWDFSNPTWSGRLGYAFGPELKVGASFSRGAYFMNHLAHLLPHNTGPGDFPQTLLGFDLHWARHHWQVWGELFLNRFKVPNVRDGADTLSYYLEARRQLSPRWWAAARWNHELHSKIRTPTGPQAWDNATYRIDFGLGFRLMRNGQVKMQYSYQHQDASFQNGRHFVVKEFTLRL